MAKGRPVLRVLVMGGGPIGLRCAVELALLGHSVLALEQRRSFTRLTLRSGGVQSRTRVGISARFGFAFHRGSGPTSHSRGRTHVARERPVQTGL